MSYSKIRSTKLSLQSTKLFTKRLPVYVVIRRANLSFTALYIRIVYKFLDSYTMPKEDDNNTAEEGTARRVEFA